MAGRRVFLALAVVAMLACARQVAADTMTLAWDSPADPTVTGYVVSYGTKPGVHNIQVNVGNTTQTTVSGLARGTTYYFVVQSYNASGLLSPASPEVAGPAVSVTALVSNTPFPAPTGAPITWTALASQGVTLEYKFFRFSPSTGMWTMVRDYSPSASFTWTPAITDRGTYALQVWARTPGSAEQYQAWAGSGMFTIVDAPITVGSLEADVPLAAGTGAPITWTAKAIGGPAPLAYRFYRLNVLTNVWTMVQDYGASNKFTWVPASNDEGLYVIQVWVRGNGSAAPYDGWRGSDLIQIRNGVPVAGALVTSTTFPAGIGTPVVWKAALGGGPLEYEFWQFSQASNSWTVAQNYGASNTFTWTPTTAGTYSFQVWARRSGMTVPYEAWAGSGHIQIVNALPTIGSISSDAGAPIGTGSPVTWTANGTGGPGPLKYRFWLYNVGKDSWTILQDFSNSNTATWTPSVGSAGTYMLQVWVKSSTSAAAFDGLALTEVFKVADSIPIVQSVTPDVGQSAPLGSPVTWTVTASGGPGPLEYRFLKYNLATATWSVAQEYSWDRTFSWVPLPGEEGSYNFQVWVRRSGSTAPYEAYSSIIPFVVR